MKIVTALLASLILTPIPSIAGNAEATNELSVRTSLSYESKYVNMGTQYAEALYVPTIDLGYGDYYLGIWMGVPAENAKLYDTEADFYAGWRYQLSDMLSLDFGATRYSYNNICSDFLYKDNSLEFYAGICANLPLSPALYIYRDIDCNSNTFKALVSHSFNLSRQLALNLSGELGYISNDNNDYTFFMARTDLEYKLTENTSALAGVRVGGSSDERIFGDGYDMNPRKNAVWYGFGIKSGY